MTTTYNPEANGKIERGHSPIVITLAKACKGRVGNWPNVLPYALWANRTTHSSMTGNMPDRAHEACKGRVGNWPKVLPYALWADRTTHSSVTGYMPIKLMTGQRPVMPIEEKIATWAMLSWESEMRGKKEKSGGRRRRRESQEETRERGMQRLLMKLVAYSRQNKY